MATLITFLLANFTLTFYIIGLIASIIYLSRRKKPWSPAVVVEALFSWFLFFSIGASFFYNFVAHVFFGEFSAKLIGWADSPFQSEVGWASLGYAVVGFLAFRGGLGLRTAAIVGTSCFLLGAAGTHIKSMIESRNFAAGNAGVIFYTDILTPIMGFLMLYLQHRYSKKPLQRAE